MCWLIVSAEPEACGGHIRGEARDRCLRLGIHLCARYTADQHADEGVNGPPPHLLDPVMDTHPHSNASKSWFATIRDWTLTIYSMLPYIKTILPWTVLAAGRKVRSGALDTSRVQLRAGY